ncbi:MAG: leucine-rich repeat domain-containing protein [Clostridia bacterium]|nr:leucine-rich repeat domain-containing protein [Clostridia bacterium]
MKKMLCSALLAAVALCTVIISAEAAQAFDYTTIQPGFSNITGWSNWESDLLDQNVCTHQHLVWDMEVQEIDDLDLYIQAESVSPVDGQHHSVTGHRIRRLFCPECGKEFSNEVTDEVETYTIWHTWDYVIDPQGNENSTGHCSICNYQCPHTRLESRESGTQWIDRPSDDTYHDVYQPAGSTDIYCRDCGRKMANQFVPAITEEEEHDYDVNGVCYACGHVRSQACLHLHKRTWQDYEYFVYDQNWNTIYSYGKPIEQDDLYHTVDGDEKTFFYCYDCGLQGTLSVKAKQVNQSLPHWYLWDDNKGKFTCVECGHVNGCTHPNRYRVQFMEANGVVYHAYGKNDVHRVHSNWNNGDYCPDCGLLLDGVSSSFTAEMPHQYDSNGVCNVCGYSCTHQGDAVQSIIQNEEYTPLDTISHRYSYDLTLPNQCPYCKLNLGGTSHEQESALHSYNRGGICLNCGYDFFSATDGLAELSLPNNLSQIEAMAFEHNGAQRVTIHNGCVTIGSCAFANCEHLVRVDIPATVTTIAADAFAGTPCVIVAPENSAAIEFARNANLPYVAK